VKAQSKGDLRAGLAQYLIHVFASPQFLFRTELGPPERDQQTPVTLTAFEKAAALSYFLADGPPDAELSAAARGGTLDAAAMGKQARRLLLRPESSLGLTKLLREQYQTAAVLNTRKDPMAFKTWTDVLAKDLSTE